MVKEKILTKGRIAGADCFTDDNVIWHRPVGYIAVGCRTAIIEDLIIPVAACHYWRLSDPFAAYTTAETPNAFQWDAQPHKLPLPVGDVDPQHPVP